MSMTFRPDNDDMTNIEAISKTLGLKTKSSVIKISLKITANLLK
ncbi:MAG: hypothetical protein N3D75_01010 [Candidatus Aenigmarchaeota archaeon]|nr:hypothetical protein [Candidatus Aenigmarchaeota archaeon]